MANKIQEKLKACVESLKTKKDISSLTAEELQTDIEKEFQSTLKITPEKWIELCKHKLLKFDIEDMSMQEESLKTITEKLADKIKNKQNEKDEKEGHFKLTVAIPSSEKARIAKLDTKEGLIAVKEIIIKQAADQGIPESKLDRPCKQITNINTKQSVQFPEDTKFIDSLSYVLLANIKGKDAFANEGIKKENKPEHKTPSTVEEMMDNLLGLNDIHADKKKTETELSGMGMQRN